MSLARMSPNEEKALGNIYTARGPVSTQESLQRGLLDYRHVLWRKKGFLLACLLLGTAIGGAITVYQEPTYVARTTLEFQPRVSTNPIKGEQLDDGYDESAIATYEHVLESRSLRGSVVQRLRAQASAHSTKQVGSVSLLLQGMQKVGFNLDFGPQTPTYAAALLQAARTLKAKTIPQTRIVEITCESALPMVAADFANGLVNEFMDEDLQSHWNSTQSTNKQLTEELAQLKAKLEESERTLNEYTQSTGMAFSSPNTTLVDDELKRTQEDLAQAENDRVTKEARYKFFIAGSPEMITGGADTVLQTYKSQLADLERLHADLSATFTSAYPKVKRLEAQKAEVEKSIESERQSFLDHLKNEYDEALRRQQMFAGVYQGRVKAATLEAQRVLQYLTLKNDFDANRQLYESVLQRVKELNVSSAVHASNIRIIDVAEPPNAPDRPNPVRNVGFGLFTGLIFGVGCVFWKDQVNSSLWGPGEGPLMLNLPELGVIPSSRFSHDGRSEAKFRFFTPVTQIITFGGESQSQAAGPLAAWQRQPAQVTESFRRTIASILFSATTRAHPKVIVITSPAQGDGKSTVCSNLAIAMAEIKLRVLVVDCDLRKPALHRIFDVANTWGISNILEENTAIPSLPLEALCRETKITGLSLLTSGPPTASVSQLVFSDRLREFLDRCRREFDIVVIDTPPLLQVSDARALSRHSDGVVLVLRSGASKLKAAVASAQVLSQDGSPILGTVLNNWDPRSGGGDHIYNMYNEVYQDRAR